MTFNKNCTCYLNCLTCGTFFTSTMCRYLCCCCCRLFLGRIFFFSVWLSIFSFFLFLFLFSLDWSMLCLCVFLLQLYIFNFSWFPSDKLIDLTKLILRNTYGKRVSEHFTIISRKREREHKLWRMKKMSLERKNSNSSGSSKKKTHTRARIMKIYEESR